MQDHPQREDIGPVVQRFALQLLGGHVGHGAHHDAVTGVKVGRHLGVQGLLRLRRRDLGQAEIQDLDAAVRRDHHVAGLEIAVDDALVVGGGEGLGQRRADLDDPLDRHPTLGDEAVKRLTFDQLHHEEGDLGRGRVRGQF